MKFNFFEGKPSKTRTFYLLLLVLSVSANIIFLKSSLHDDEELRTWRHENTLHLVESEGMVYRCVNGTIEDVREFF